MNDRQIGRFTIKIIECIEMIGEQIGLAVKNGLIFEKLEAALNEIEVLRGMIPICCHCKSIRDDEGYWNQIETYIRGHSDAEFSHSICPECVKDLYGDLEI